MARPQTDTLKLAARFSLLCDRRKRGLVLICFVFGFAVVGKTLSPEPLCAFPGVFGQPVRFHFAAAQVADEEEFGD